MLTEHQQLPTCGKTPPEYSEAVEAIVMSHTRLPIVIFRSICCGMAATVVAIFAWMWGHMIFAGFARAKAHPSGSVEVGWDLVTIGRNSPGTVAIVAVIGFGIGFALGFRSFSRLAQRN